jgi:hypothetical protein
MRRDRGSTPPSRFIPQSVEAVALEPLRPLVHAGRAYAEFPSNLHLPDAIRTAQNNRGAQAVALRHRRCAHTPPEFFSFSLRDLDPGYGPRHTPNILRSVIVSSYLSDARLDALTAAAGKLDAADAEELLSYFDVTRALLTELAGLTMQDSCAAHSGHTNVLATRRAVVETCEALVAGDITLFEAATILTSIATDLDPRYEDPDLLVFVAINSEADHITTIDTMRGWHPSVADARKAQRETFVAAHLSEAVASANDLIRRYR